MPDLIVAITQKTLPVTGAGESVFSVEAPPIRRGRARQTRDMAEIYSCICGYKSTKTTELKILSPQFVVHMKHHG